MAKKHHRRYHRNPAGALMKEAGKVVLATAGGAALAVAGSIGASKLTTDPRKHAAIVGLGGVALGVGLHVNDMAPRLGKALAGGGATLAASELAAHYQVESRIRGLVGGTAATAACTVTGQTRDAAGTCNCPTGQHVNTAGTACTAEAGAYPLAGATRALGAGYPAPGVRQPAGYPMAGVSRTR